MPNTDLARRAGWYQELTTQGNGPADASAWAAGGNQLRFQNGTLDTTSFRQAMLEDERQQTEVLAYDQRIKGIKGGVEFPFETYLTGSEDTVRADGDTTTTSLFMQLLEHAFGGLDLATETHVAAALGTHSTTQVELDASTNLAPGDWIGLPDSDGIIHHRRVQTLASDIATFHRELPFTPQDADVIRGLAVVYPLESRLIDSSAGPYTLSWLLEVGLDGSTEAIEALGCVSAVTGITLTRNAVAKLVWNTMVAKFNTQEAAPTPDWSSVAAHGEAGLAIGPDTEVFFQDRGVATENSLHVPEFSVTPGIVRAPIPTQTNVDANMPGISHYALARNPCDVQMTVTPHADSNLAAFNAGTLKHLQYERRSTDGKGWSLYFPRCEIMDTPAGAAADVARAQQIPIRALKDTDAPGGAAAYWASRMQIVFA